MSVETEQALSQAFELIEAGKLDEAQANLKPILDADKDNADAWWLYAHAVTDSETAHIALSNVRRLDPDYLNAGELLYALESQSTGHQTANLSENELSFFPPLPSSLPGMSVAKTASSLDSEDDWDILDDNNEESYISKSRRPALLLIVGTFIFVVVAAIVILQPQTQPAINDAVRTATTVNQSSPVENPTADFLITSQATIDNQQESTSVPGVEIENYPNLNTILNTFTMPQNNIAIEKTDLGSTLMVSVCTEAGRALRETLPDVLKTLSKESLAFDLRTDAVAVRMLDCASNNDTLLVIGTSIRDARAYAAGDLTDDAFQATWLPVS